MFAIDTHYLFPETYELWREVEQRYNAKVEVFEGPSPEELTATHGEKVWERKPDLYLAVAKVEPLARALGGLDCWITGIRRDQSSTRANAPKLGWDAAHELWKANPLADWSDDDCWTYIRERGLPYNALHDRGYASVGDTHSTIPGAGRDGRWAGSDRTECGLHTTVIQAPVHLSHLDELEAEAIHIMREVAAELERPVLLFSGGKDSIVLLRLAEKAFRPGKFPFPVMHVDTGHNFPEVIEFRDRRVDELGERLIVASVQESIDRGRVVEETGPRASRNQLQTTTLLDAIEQHGFDAAIGGARRDEERARAKERIFSFRDDFGQWNPRAQRPELWNLYNARVRKGEHVRVFPISNWTELDVWQYVARERLELPPIYFAHEREVFRRDGMLYAASEVVERMPDEEPFAATVRFRTVGDMSCTGGVLRRRARSKRSSSRSRRPVSRSAARPAQTTASAKRRWRTASVSVTSEQMQATELLRLVTCGSVDDGKSTLIGRLLYDTKQILVDQLEHIEETSERRGDGYVNLALLTDGLRAEREQGITIDVAYRSFVTPRRRFLLADAPGHVQYTRNMVTGASTAEVAVVLLDARKGVIEQTRRHTYIAAILGIPHVVVAVNKMDLVGFAEERFREIEAELAELVQQLGARDLLAVPISALRGDNVVDRSTR